MATPIREVLGGRHQRHEYHMVSKMKKDEQILHHNLHTIILFSAHTLDFNGDKDYIKFT